MEKIMGNLTYPGYRNKSEQKHLYPLRREELFVFDYPQSQKLSKLGAVSVVEPRKEPSSRTYLLVEEKSAKYTPDHFFLYRHTQMSSSHHKYKERQSIRWLEIYWFASRSTYPSRWANISRMWARMWLQHTYL